MADFGVCCRDAPQVVYALAGFQYLIRYTASNANLRCHPVTPPPRRRSGQRPVSGSQGSALSTTSWFIRGLDPSQRLPRNADALKPPSFIHPAPLIRLFAFFCCLYFTHHGLHRRGQLHSGWRCCHSQRRWCCWHWCKFLPCARRQRTQLDANVRRQILLSFMITALLAIILSSSVIFGEFRGKDSIIRRKLLNSYSDSQIMQGIGIQSRSNLSKHNTRL